MTIRKLLIISILWFTCAAPFAAALQFTPKSDSNISSAATAESGSKGLTGGEIAFWSTFAGMNATFFFLIIAVFGSLRRSPNWSLADALSEEAANQASTVPPVKPVMVASSSRLIALIGLLAILVLYLGFGYCALWMCFVKGKIDIDTKSLLSFLFGGATLFAPYLANQLRDAFSTFAGPPKT
jgi:hypothetical protein